MELSVATNYVSRVMMAGQNNEGKEPSILKPTPAIRLGSSIHGRKSRCLNSQESSIGIVS